MGCRIGCDLVAVAGIAESIDRFGQRYLRRVYTPHEVATCGDQVHRLAARFAAKEATIKALRVADPVLPLTSIEVRRDVGGWCVLSLSGAAARLAEEEGLSNFQLSLSHETDYAMAVVHCDSYA